MISSLTVGLWTWWKAGSRFDANPIQTIQTSRLVSLIFKLILQVARMMRSTGHAFMKFIHIVMLLLVALCAVAPPAEAFGCAAPPSV